MTKLSVLLPVIILSLSLSTECKTIHGNGNVVKESRQVQQFENVSLIGSPDVIISYGNDFSVSVECESNFLEYIETSVKDNTLEIKQKNNINLRPSYREGHTIPIIIHVVTPVIKDISLIGSGDIFATKDVIYKDDVSILLTGAGDIKCKKINASNSCVTNVNGSGDLVVNYIDSKKIIVSLNGSGDLNIDNCKCQDLYTALIGSGDLDVEGICESLSVILEGSGDLDVKGVRYNVCNVNADGSGDIYLRKGGTVNFSSNTKKNNVKWR